MIRLTDTLYWDGNKTLHEQDNEVQNYVSNIIATYDKITTKEAIPNSDLFRVLTASYQCNGFVIIEAFEYQEPVTGSGWSGVKSYKVNCYAE